MRYKLLGRSGLRVSELALGTMTFGEDWGWGASKDESRKIFDAFTAAGGNFIDTAINYTDGTSERYVGEFIEPDRDYYILATKYSLNTRKEDPNAGGNQRKNMVRSVEASLKRMKTDYIDLYWLHMWDYMTPVDEVLRGLDDLVRSGKVLYIGVSDTPAWVVAKANMLAELRGWSRFVALQVPYNLARRDPERDLFPMARDFDLALIPWGVIGGGALTGKYNRETTEPKRYEDTSDHYKEVAEVVQDVADEIQRTPAQVAINWARGQKFGVPMIPILGARNLDQIRENLACLDFELSQEQVTKLSNSSPIDLGFPYTFLGSDYVKELIFGETYDKIDVHRH